MIVRCKERARPALLGDVFHCRPGDGKAVERRSAASHLVQDEQALRRGIFQDGRHFAHLHHEGGLAAIEVIRSADAGKNAVGQGDIRRGGGHKAAHVGHEHDQGYLTHIGGFTRHIRPGDNHHAVLIVQVRIIGHEHCAAKPFFDDRVASIDDFVAPLIVDGRAHIFIFLRHARQREQYVQRLERACRSAQARQSLLERFPNLTEKLVFQAHGIFLSAENFSLQFFEFIGNETFAVGKRLFADVAVRHQVVKRARNLDIIAKNAVVADFQVFDPGFLTLAALHLRKVCLAVLRYITQFIQFLGITGADHAAFAYRQRRFIINGA